MLQWRCPNGAASWSLVNAFQSVSRGSFLSARGMGGEQCHIGVCLYLLDEACYRFLMVKSGLGMVKPVQGPPAKIFGDERSCLSDGCGVRLSRYNTQLLCFVHHKRTYPRSRGRRRK